MRSFEVNNLACRRGGLTIFEGVSFNLSAGQASQIFGANGSGKSTLLQALAGLIPPSAGTITRDPSDEEGATPWVFQGHENGLKPLLSLRENLSFWQASYGTRDHVAMEMVATKVGLSRFLDEPVRIFSAGQKRRAGLARCLLARRPLWFMDEPTAALDSEGKALVAQLLKDHLAADGLAIIATHEVLDVPALQLTLAAPTQEILRSSSEGGE